MNGAVLLCVCVCLSWALLTMAQDPDTDIQPLLDGLTKRLTDLEGKQLETENREKSTMTEVQSLLDGLTKRMQVLEAKEQEPGNGDTSMVVFSAIANAPATIGPLRSDSILVYSLVSVNIGSAYNPNTGIFTAPVQGVYYFTFFYHAGGKQSSDLFLIKNEEVVVQTSDQRSSYDAADTGGNAVFIHLQSGDQVYVRLKRNTHVWAAAKHTTFSGFLLR